MPSWTGQRLHALTFLDTTCKVCMQCNAMQGALLLDQTYAFVLSFCSRPSENAIASQLRLAYAGCGLSECNLEGADFRRANLSNADLRRTNLTDANLKGAILTNAKLDGVTLTHKDFSGCNLQGVYAMPCSVLCSPIKHALLFCDFAHTPLAMQLLLDVFLQTQGATSAAGTWKVPPSEELTCPMQT